MLKVNIYTYDGVADHVSLITRTTPEGTFTGICLYVEHPVTIEQEIAQANPFRSNRGENELTAITLWGNEQLKKALAKALSLLDPKRELEVGFNPIESIRYLLERREKAGFGVGGILLQTQDVRALLDAYDKAQAAALPEGARTDRYFGAEYLREMIGVYCSKVGNHIGGSSYSREGELRTFLNFVEREGSLE